MNYLEKDIRRRIYWMRGCPVMLDRDLAELYNVRSIALRQQVRRNHESFPEDFMFKLTALEVAELVSQNVIPSKQSLGGYYPYVFTEQGVAMLSSVLKSREAIRVKIAIMRAFVRMRQVLSKNKDLAKRLEKLEKRVDLHDTDIRLLIQDVRRLLSQPAPDFPLEKVRKIRGFEID